MKKTQNQLVAEILRRDGEISRNQCLRMMLSRLSARIDNLEKEGWEFTTFKRYGDYVYKVVRAPEVKEVTIEDECWREFEF